MLTGWLSIISTFLSSQSRIANWLLLLLILVSAWRLINRWALAIAMVVLYFLRGTPLSTWINVLIGGWGIFAIVSPLFFVGEERDFFFASLGVNDPRIKELRNLTHSAFPEFISERVNVILILATSCLVGQIVLKCNWWGVLALEMGTIAFWLLESLSPPIAIYLGTSGKDQVALWESVQHALFPLRVVSFLDFSKGDRGNRMYAQRGTVRQASIVPWHPLVDKFIQKVPIIILDARGDSLPVRAERLIISDHALFWKLIVVGDQHDGEAENGKIVFGTKASAHVSPSELLVVLETVIRDKELPTPK
jgi:hypothetical protein